MKVKLINKPTLDFIDNGIGKCYDKGCYLPDTKKAYGRIDRVCNKMRHSSMLRFVHYIFDVEISTSVLLELSRHQVGNAFAFMSTRYCIKSIDINVEPSRSELVNELLEKQVKDIKELIKNNPELKPDDIKLLLPQAFIYKGQVEFNGQALQHFLQLRTHKSSHFQIRDFAYALFNAVPDEQKFLFIDFVYPK
jgi:thymidylate synthase (FAD)